MRATVTVADPKGQFVAKEAFFIRLNNGTREMTDAREIDKYIAGRWGQKGIS